MVEGTQDQEYRATLGALKQKCSPQNVAPPGNPTAIVTLALAGLDHLQSSIRFDAQVVSLTDQLDVGKRRFDVFENASTDLSQLRAELTTAVASEAQDQASKAETMGKLVRAETRSVTLDRDLELRGSRCTLLTNEAASLRADV